jgi:hypothetical protein
MSIRCHGGIWGSGGIAALTNVDAGWVWSASGPGRFALGEELPVWIEYEVRWARELVWTPVLRVITMVTPNRNCGLFKKSQFIEFTFIWFSKVKFVERRKSVFLRHLRLPPRFN